ncbi:MAG: hypothetical protein CM1200mP9_03530 [Gammaproteobacteria bacterium]|nr:MAG: hypothetical protein CM1200mP9_03530 [Gammaproteobacteria bacterium]
MAKLDIAEKRIPQDGVFLCVSGGVRSTCACLFTHGQGERVVLRLLEKGSGST